MQFFTKFDDRIFEVDLSQPIDISIPLKFNGPQPNSYGVKNAVSTPCDAGDLIGDTRQGGSCNFEEYTLIPHCNGTHTECIGHITRERISIRECLQDVFIPCTLISINPEKSAKTDDKVTFESSPNDEIITKSNIQNALATNASNARDTLSHAALVVRTLPNSESKLSQKYGEFVPPYFSNDAMEFIVKLKVKHLLVDLPSIDRIFDNGQLTNHRLFWDIEPGKFETSESSRFDSTITELVYIPNEIRDGNYLLNLQIAAFEADASPSRPVLFRYI